MASSVSEQIHRVRRTVVREDPKLVEALSNRSKCQACGEFIAFASIRVGMPARHNGVTITKWLHPSCFAAYGLRCDYAPTDRAHCSGDGSPINKGEPRLVMFLESCSKVLHQKVYKPQNAAPFLRELFALPGVALGPGDVEGLDALEIDHRPWVESALAGHAVGPAPVSSVSGRVLASEQDPLFLHGCTIRISWPQSRKGLTRMRTGTIHFRPQQPRQKQRNHYLLLTERRSGGLRERKTSWRKLRRRSYEVLTSSRRQAPRRWCDAEISAVRVRHEAGESLDSVARALARTALAVGSKL